jgi:hypothetical protein
MQILFSLSHTTVGAITHGVAGSPTLPSSYPVHKLFFCFGGGLPLHKVQFLILRDPLGVPTTCFAILPLKISYNFLLSVPSLPRCDRCPALHRPMLFVVVHSSNMVAVRHIGNLFLFCLVAAVSALGPLCHCCIPDIYIVLRLFVLSQFLVLPGSWSNPF